MGKVSKKIWIIAAVALVIVAAGIAIFLNNRPYSVLITSANAEEISTVMSWLETQGVQDYRMEGSPTTHTMTMSAPSLPRRSEVRHTC